MTTNTEGWEKEFEALFGGVAYPFVEGVGKRQKDVMDYIQNLLTKTEADTLERVRGRIEKMKEEVVGDPEMNINIKRKAKNQAIDIVLTSLTENNNKL